MQGVTELSVRHLRLVELVASGLRDRDIAAMTGTTTDAVKFQLKTIFDKLGLWNRVELAIWYERRRADGSLNDIIPQA